MISRIFFTFVLFAALAYYFDIDVRSVVDKSGAPEWLAEHGIAPKQSTASAAGTDATTTAP